MSEQPTDKELMGFIYNQLMEIKNKLDQMSKSLEKTTQDESAECKRVLIEAELEANRRFHREKVRRSEAKYLSMPRHYADDYPIPGQPYNYMPEVAANPGVVDRSHKGWEY